MVAAYPVGNGLWINLGFILWLVAAVVGTAIFTAPSAGILPIAEIATDHDGATAFVIAQFLNVSYADVAIAAIIPASTVCPKANTAIAKMVVAIIVVITIGKVLRARYGVVRTKHGANVHFSDDTANQAENQRLRDELKAMKDRLAVLERLATDNNDSGARLDREIEKLRDRP